MRQRFVCQWLSCTFCFTVHLDHGNAGGGACDLSPPVPAVCRPVLPPLPAPGQRPVGPAYIRRRLVAGLCPLTGSSGSSFPIEGRENRQSIVPQCFAGFTGSFSLDYRFAASTLCSITGTAHRLCTRSRLIFSATPIPESRMGRLSWRSEDMPKYTAFRKYQRVGIVQPLRRSQLLWMAFTGAFMQNFFQFPQKTVGGFGEHLIALPDD